MYVCVCFVLFLLRSLLFWQFSLQPLVCARSLLLPARLILRFVDRFRSRPVVAEIRKSVESDSWLTFLTLCASQFSTVSTNFRPRCLWPGHLVAARVPSIPSPAACEPPVGWCVCASGFFSFFCFLARLFEIFRCKESTRHCLLDQKPPSEKP